VGLEIGDIVVDYQVGAHNGVLFLRYVTCTLLTAADIQPEVSPPAS
jgi:hypothetical protein